VSCIVVYVSTSFEMGRTKIVVRPLRISSARRVKVLSESDFWRRIRWQNLQILKDPCKYQIQILELMK